MAYEIPQQLEYRERVVFGLTFSQLAWAMLFGLVSAMVFLKTPFSIWVKCCIILPLVGLACCFMFLRLTFYLRNWFVWLKCRKLSKEKVEKFVGIKGVKNNALITSKNNSFSVLKVLPINFSIKQESEQDAIVKQFQKFLNSLDFPIQVFINTDTLDLNSYLESLHSRVKGVVKKTKNKVYLKLFNSYKEHLENTLEGNSVKNRIFYVIVPSLNDLEIQTRIVEEKLRNLNLKVTRLKDEELETFQKSTLKLKELENKRQILKFPKSFNQVIYAHGYPRIVEAGFLDKIVSCVGNFDFSMHIQPFAIETMMIMLNKQLQKQRADLYASKLKGAVNPSLEIQCKDTLKVLEALQKGSEKLFNVSLYINCKSNTLKDLNMLTKKVEAELNSMMIIPRVASFRMLQGLKSTLPLGIDALKVGRNITANALSAFFPFTSPFLEVDEEGVWLGLNKNNIPIIRDIFHLSNPNGLVLAQSGGGKSYFSKLLIARYLLNGVKVLVIDPQGEYKELVKQFNGQRIRLSRTSKTMINPLDLMGHDYAEKRLSLMDLMQVMLGELSEPQKTFIDKALTKAYKRKEINDNPETWANEPPILSDVLEILEGMEKEAIVLEKSTIRSLINRLSMYVDGVFAFLNKHTNINFNNQFVCFDIGDLPKQVKPVMMFLVLDYIYMQMRKDKERKLLVVDEAWSLLSRVEDAAYIFEIVKTCRKFNLGLVLINQEVESMLGSEAGKSVLANTAYTLLLKQKAAVIDQIQKTFHLSDAEKNFLITTDVGEGILIMEDEHTEIKVIASKEEHKIITTNPDEEIVHVPKKSKPKGKKVVINVDADKDFYRKKDLNKDEIDYLIREGYTLSSHVPLGEIRQEEFLLKLNKVEKAEHFFLVRSVEEYLKPLTREVKVFVTTKPDVIFETPKGKKVAIEVETGTMMRKGKDIIRNKVEQLNKIYGKRWFFLVTDGRYSYAYQKFGKVETRKSVAKKLRNYFKNQASGKQQKNPLKKQQLQRISRRQNKNPEAKPFPLNKRSPTTASQASENSLEKLAKEEHSIKLKLKKLNGGDKKWKN